ncbi:hypothetical protein ACGIF2_17180 [Cellulomonas sp. P22]|uniref:hypothetical protein n=1 Tax=Cellulomonas sp. P22 TaxID=3373189 RepID=UPI0037AC4FFB
MSNPYAPPSEDTPRPDPSRTRPVPDRPHGGPRPGPPSGPPSPGRDPRQGPPPAPLPPIDPEALRVASRRVMNFGLLMIATIVVSTLPLPWRAASLVFVVLAIVAGVRALVATRRARVRGALTPMLLVGLAFAGMLSLTLVTMLATWPVQQAHEECLRGALTVSARAGCDQTYEQDLLTWQENLTSRATRG